MRLIGYARVSTDGQDLTRQTEALKEAGCNVIFEEKISGGKEQRPELDKMLKELKAGDCVVIQKLDRLGRSLSHLLKLIEGFKRDGIQFKSLTDNFDTTTSQGIFIFQIMAAVAELERSMIRERTKDGLRVKKSQGVTLGRPFKVVDTEKGYKESGVNKNTYYAAKRRAAETNERIKAALDHAKVIKIILTDNQ
jgi:DNA invertase Pin-like site-specific DNA recombinase